MWRNRVSSFAVPFLFFSLLLLGRVAAPAEEPALLQVSGALPLAVRASAADGFEAVFSCAELFESMGATRAMIVWKVDGKPLAADRGPLRLVVLTDKEPSRSIHGLRTIEVLDLPR